MSNVILWNKSSAQFCIHITHPVYFNKSDIKPNIYKI